MGCVESRGETIVAKPENQQPKIQASQQFEKKSVQFAEGVVDKENEQPVQEGRSMNRMVTVGPFIKVGEEQMGTPAANEVVKQFGAPQKRKYHRELTSDSIPDYNEEADIADRFDFYRTNSKLDQCDEEGEIMREIDNMS